MTDDTDSDDEIVQFYEETTDIDVRVMRTWDELEAEGATSFPTAMRTQFGSGSIGEHDLNLTLTMGGEVWVEFDDGPTVVLGHEEMTRAAFVAAQEHGYLADDENEE